VVRENTGEECQGYELKDHLKEKKDKIDYDDDGFW
jgi:hypothetical protein